MRKLLTIGGGVLLILSFLSTTAKANSIILPAISNSSPTNDLSHRLAADKDFQEFSYSINQLVGKLQVTKTGVIFQKYFQHTISDVELSTLLTSLNFASKDVFSAFLRRTFILKEEILCKFPELANNSDIKLVVELAAKKAITISGKPSHTTGDCWAAFIVASFACLEGCSIYASAENWETCMWACNATIAALGFWCAMTAD